MNYFTVQKWMVTDLKLKGAERDVFAIIYGFSQDGESDFHGSLQYLVDLTGYSKNAICTALKKLVEKNYLIKHEKMINGIKHVRYTSNLDTIQVTCTGGIQVTCINNIDSNNKNKSIINNTTTEPEDFNFGKRKKPKQNLYDKCMSAINDFTDDGKIRTLLVEYLNMLIEINRERGTVLYSNVFRGKLRDLKSLPREDWEKIIQRTLDKGWIGFYSLTASENIRNKFSEGHGINSTSYYDSDYAEENERKLAEREKHGQRTKF